MIVPDERWWLHACLRLVLLIRIGVLSSVAALGASTICNHIPGLVPPQRILCQQRPDAMLAVGAGAQLALEECQYQFRRERWNCTPTGERGVFGYHLRVATREAAYMHAVTAAGVAHAVAMACIRGTLRGCGCDVDKQGFSSMSGTPAAKFRWGGCSADVNYGLDFSRDFVDQRENTQSARSLMNLHNNEAGRRVLEQTIKLQCRCHGASGSCSLKTCWNSLPSFREVAMALKSRYNKAIQVQAFLAGRKRLPTFLRVKRIQGFRKPQPRQLVFLDHSPSYCEASAVIGNMGTDGRTCRRAKGKGRMAHDSCDLLCCGRGYDTREVTVVSRCNCTFYWCCNVRCHNCIHRTEVFTCK